MWLGMGLSWDWLGCQGKGKGRRKNMFLAGRVVYVHYINDNRQGALQSNCVINAFWWSVGMT